MQNFSCQYLVISLRKFQQGGEIAERKKRGMARKNAKPQNFGRGTPQDKASGDRGGTDNQGVHFQGP